MKILAIGGGSMGRRRLRDLTYLNPDEIILFEPAAARCQEVAASFGVRGFTDFETALAEGPAAVTISTPPSLHQPYVERAMELGLSVFAEVPFILDVAALARVAEMAPAYGAVIGISHSLRYYPPFRLIHDLIHGGAIGRPLYLEYSLGNYLPDWHPYEDYRKFYGSDAKLGGAGLDILPHEFNAIQWWMGNITSVSARLSKLSSLDINGPDNHDMLLSFDSGARGYYHNDIIERGTRGRHVRIAGEEGTIEWHQNAPSVRVFQGGENRGAGYEEAADWQSALNASAEVTRNLARQKSPSGQVPPSGCQEFNYESCYLREMRHFVEAARGEAPYTMATVAEELQTQRVYQAVLDSNEDYRELQVGEPAPLF